MERASGLTASMKQGSSVRSLAGHRLGASAPMLKQIDMLLAKAAAALPAAVASSTTLPPSTLRHLIICCGRGGAMAAVDEFCAVARSGAERSARSQASGTDWQQLPGKSPSNVKKLCLIVQEGLSFHSPIRRGH